MGEKDITEKILEDHNDVFADIINGLVFCRRTENHWYAKKNIKALMKIPDGMEKYINDYKIQIFEVAWLTEEEIERFQSDFRIVANFFTQKRKNKDYIPDDPTEIKYVDEVLKLLNVMTGDKRYEKIFQKKERSSEYV